MHIKKGIPASPGISIAKAFLLDTAPYLVTKRPIETKDIPEEVNRFQKAMGEVLIDIQTLRQRLTHTFREKATPIIEAHLMMLQDQYLHQEIIKQIKEHLYNVEYAVTTALKRYAKALLSMENEFLASRVQDIYDIERRLLQKLLKKRSDEVGELKEDVIIIANDLTPTQTISLERSKIKGLATNAGGQTSHTAIIARSLGIPAVVGLKSITFDVSSGSTVIIDGNRGVVIVDPDKETIKKYTARERNFIILERQLLRESKGQPTETRDGYPINLYANIDLPSEIPLALKYGSSGIGLLRTEFLYPSSDHLPTEREQFEVYKKIITQMGNREVIIRTLDLGVDKLPLDNTPSEQNPFLGCRAVRFSLNHMDVFKTQLKAILRAGEFGNIKIMFPMVSSYDELSAVKNVLHDVQNELSHNNISFNKNIDIGIMIEVPSAALIADILAKEVDFFSIGTNDLIQYTVAVDRGNEKVASLYQPAHPAVLRLIKNVLQVGKQNGKTVGMCGEMSGDIIYTVLLVGLGLKLFSMVPVLIPEVKKIIRSITLEEAQQVAQKTLSFSDAQSATNFLQEYTKQIVPQLF